MDDPILNQPPSTPPSIFIQPKSKIPKILLILISLLGMALLIGVIFITKPFNLFQPNKITTIPTKNPLISGSPLKVQESTPSEGLRIDSKYNRIGFNGKVIERGKDYLILTGGDQTIKAQINNQTKINLIIMTTFRKNPDPNFIQPPVSIPFSSIKIGDEARVLGSGNEKLLETFVILIIR